MPNPMRRRGNPASDDTILDRRELLQRIGLGQPVDRTPHALVFLGAAILFAAFLLRPDPARYSVTSSGGIVYVIDNQTGYVTPCIIASQKTRCFQSGHIADALMSLSFPAE